MNLSSEHDPQDNTIFNTPEAESGEIRNTNCLRCEDIDELLDKKSTQIDKLVEQLRDKEGRIQSLEISIKEQGRLLTKSREETTKHSEEKTRLEQEREIP